MFEHTAASDVMIPCTVLLRPDDCVELAAAVLRQTGLEAVPVVDACGRLVGIVAREMVRGHDSHLADASDSLVLVRDIMEDVVSCHDQRTSFADVMEFFAADPRPILFLVEDQRPVGFVTRGSLRALSQPVTSATFGAAKPLSGSSSYLVVSD
jgi:predicted transcriptional regulator